MNILVIEDNPILALLLKKELRSKFKCNVFEFAKIEKALSLISNNPEFVILDHYLEKTNGVDCIPIIREFSPQSKIIVHTNQAEMKVLEDALIFGADTYIPKSKDSVNEVTNFIESSISEKNAKNARWFEIFFKKSKPKEKLVFIADKDSPFSFLLQKKMIENNYTTEVFLSVVELMEQIVQNPAILIINQNICRTPLEPLIYEILNKSPQTKIIVISDQGNISHAAEMLKTGAKFYFLKNNDIVNKITSVASA